MNASLIIHHTFSKMDESSTELSNTIFLIRPHVDSYFMTDAIFTIINHSLYSNYIFSINLLSWNIIEKNLNKRDSLNDVA